MNKKKIKIERTLQLINSFRIIEIYINDKKAGIIINGEMKEVEFTGKELFMRAKIDWCKTKPLKICTNQKEIIRIEVGCNLKNRDKFMITSLSTLAYALYSLYWMFFKSSNYLYIKERSLVNNE